jgi:Rrf2 family protein
MSPSYAVFRTSTLLQILQQLVRSRVLQSERGRNGGFLLRKPPSRTTLLEIVEAIEGFVTGDVSARKRIKASAPALAVVADVCNDIARSTKSLLQTTTILQLMNAG